MSYQKRFIILLGDCAGFALALFLSAFLAKILSEQWLQQDYHISLLSPDTGQKAVLYALLVTAGLFFFSQKGHYRAQAPWWQQVSHIIVFCFFAFLIEGFINYVLKTPITRLWVGLSWILAVPFLLLMRWIAREILISLGAWKIPAVLIGGRENAIETIYALKSESYLLYNIKSVILPGAQDADITAFRNAHPDVRIVSTPNRLSPRDLVIVCPDNGQPLDYKSITGWVESAGAKYVIVPPLEGFSLYGMQPSFFFGYDVVFLRPYNRLKTITSRVLKAAIDKTGAVIALVLLSPLFLIIAWRVRRDGGPALYAQTRIGENGRPFKCWKFRSMIVNADQVLQDILARDPVARAEWERDFKLKNDPRITKIGHFLRKTSLDEIPQIFNVLRGEMSLVGPRPIVAAEQQYYGDKIEEYLSVKPGITGLWQVSGRNDITYRQRVYLDSWYVKHWSVWNDIVIVLKTVLVIMDRRGAY